MATPASSVRIGGLALRLINDGLISEEIASQAQQQAREDQISLASYLVKNDFVEASALANCASMEFGIPLLDLDVLDLDSIPISLVPEKLIRQHHALPIQKRGNRLFVAISDPMNLVALDEFKFNTGISTEPVLVEEDKLGQILDKALEMGDTSMSMDGLLDDDLDNLEFTDTEDSPSDDGAESDIDDTPIVRFVHKVLLDAINKKASDIHFEPYERTFRVRFRIDGILEEIASPPITLGPRISARLKVMSRLDISERRVPQDGRIKMQLSKKRAIDFRVNTCPTLFGEKIVLRILDPSSAMLGIDVLGYDEDQKQLYLDALAKPYGMILVTGPTGSGKTVSLYTGLNILNTPDRNISTAEDPSEINMPGVNQVNVRPKVGLTFASALRAFLRQDPDVIMVGEIRDLETAEIAIKAAQTGHLVLSTLHTNDAPQTLTRLANMGVPPFNIASAVSLIIAQRLARKLCDHCKVVDDIPQEALIEEGFKKTDLKNLTIYKAVGCDQCTNGYKGRVGIYQVMPVSEAMGRIIMEGGNSLQLADQATKEGVADLRLSGLKKVKDGVISLEEVNRVTKD
ncbi:MAG: type IV-A pilus assembly ATPase PilB [Gammaproteobacteria bacterium]|nr:type IV-A pilus assembly ATPase PilB [Gammaproteobacteria bacterium]